jgi:hypothetical protein
VPLARRDGSNGGCDGGGGGGGGSNNTVQGLGRNIMKLTVRPRITADRGSLRRNVVPSTSSRRSKHTKTAAAATTEAAAATSTSTEAGSKEENGGVDTIYDDLLYKTSLYINTCDSIYQAVFSKSRY